MYPYLNNSLSQADSVFVMVENLLYITQKSISDWMEP